MSGTPLVGFGFSYIFSVITTPKIIDSIHKCLVLQSVHRLNLLHSAGVINFSELGTLQGSQHTWYKGGKLAKQIVGTWLIYIDLHH